MNGKQEPEQHELIEHVLTADEAYRLIAEARDNREMAERAAEPFVEAVKQAKKAEEMTVALVQASYHKVKQPELELEKV